MSFEMCRKKSRAKLLFGKFIMRAIGVIYTRFGKCMGTIWGHLCEVWEAIWGHKGSFIYGKFMVNIGISDIEMRTRERLVWRKYGDFSA